MSYRRNDKRSLRSKPLVPLTTDYYLLYTMTHRLNNKRSLRSKPLVPFITSFINGH